MVLLPVGMVIWISHMQCGTVQDAALAVCKCKCTGIEWNKWARRHVSGVEKEFDWGSRNGNVMM